MYVEPSIKEQFDRLLTRFTAKQTIHDSLGIRLTHIAPDKVMATMPVDERTCQPFGLLHGGASVVLAESVCSIGAWLHVKPEKQFAVGLEINANHVRSMTSGIVTASATPIHIGASTQLWTTALHDEQGRLVCVSRCTIAVKDVR